MTAVSQNNTELLTRILLVEDDPAFCVSINQTIKRYGGKWELVSFNFGKQALAFLKEKSLPVDLALIDIGLPDISGIEVIRKARAQYPEIPILVSSIYSAERNVLEAIRAGARGYILKDANSDALVAAIEQALRGDYPISPSLARYLFKLAGQPTAPRDLKSLSVKEIELLGYIAKGFSYSQSAELMNVKVSTVQTHIRNLYRKLDVHSQVQAVKRAEEWGAHTEIIEKSIGRGTLDRLAFKAAPSA